MIVNEYTQSHTKQSQKRDAQSNHTFNSSNESVNKLMVSLENKLKYIVENNIFSFITKDASKTDKKAPNTNVKQGKKVEMNRSLSNVKIGGKPTTYDNGSSHNDEKDVLKSIHATISKYMKSENSERDRHRVESKAGLDRISQLVDSVYSDKGLSVQHIGVMIDVLRLMDDVLEDIKSICSIRGRCVEVSYSLMLVIINSIIDYLLVEGSTQEKNIWKDVIKHNSSIDSQIKNITEKLNESRKSEENWKNKLELAKKESLYLSKMVKTVNEYNKSLNEHVKTLELEKAILTNDLANSKLNSLPNMKKSVHRVSVMQTDPISIGSSITDASHIRWLKIRDGIEEQYKVKNVTMGDFKLEMDQIVNKGLEKVDKHNAVITNEIKEQQTDTEDIRSFGDKQTQTTAQFVDASSSYTGSHSSRQDASITTDTVEIMRMNQGASLLQEYNSISTQHNEKVLTRYSLHYQLKECLKLKELLDGYLFNAASSKNERAVAIGSILDHQKSYILVPSDLSTRIIESLETVDNLKLRYNSIGETLVTLKEKNKKLQANNYEYENQNHEMAKMIEDLKKKVEEVGRNNINTDVFKTIDVINTMNRQKLVDIIAEYASNLKEALQDSLNMGGSPELMNRGFRE